MSFQPADSSLAAIRTKVRRLTASPGESTLPTDVLDQYINTFYTNDFPYGIKLDQMRSIYTFYTEPYVDVYPLDVNYNQGIRAPFYVDGIQGTLFKDRDQFYRMWPRWPTSSKQSTNSFSGTITGATNANPVRINSTNHGLSNGAVVFITGVLGMTEINDEFFTIQVVNSNRFSLVGVDGTSFGVYSGGGVWKTNSQTFSFTVSPIPFLRNMVTIGGTDTYGESISVFDDGQGNLFYGLPNRVEGIPFDNPPNPDYANRDDPPTPGMFNYNTGNPGLMRTIYVGSVNYQTGEIDFTLPEGISLQFGTDLDVRVSQYQPGRPYCILFWNNNFTIRPVPSQVHKIEIETYLTPVQFFDQTDSPILAQWWQYIAIGTAIHIFEDRNDFEGVNSLMPIFQRQEALVLERQGVEEIYQRNSTIYNSSGNSLGWNNNYLGGFY